MFRYLLLITCFYGCLCSEVPAGSWTSDYQTLQALDRFMNKLTTGDGNVELYGGIKLVKVNDSRENERGRSAHDSIMTRLRDFFSSYELKLKLSDIFQDKQDMIDVLKKAFHSLNQLQGVDGESSRGKGGGGFGGGKKGGNAILMMATMMGGTMAALGFGGLGMLVMKALTVSSMALLLSSVIGLRRLLRRPDDDAGFNRISYIPVHAERRRRSLSDLPYRAYVNRK